ncbi:MAG: hypothetical protein COT26_02305 [Candidatus Kerfeldbacteria bacterium CG08_land_8_20_14_0_20_43_14]|uniref:Uncharacterized protein n=1 Tax=Candidatus Kerfeldbacteria bacterium CG08_land_8_20_14_0_20_43_14 TaxID=2014246 RepID=A0A2H0YSB3_9BACT|nr:MAG: hypothetical protein COT26_02305 [Candidatus Kerfeldbacteria bacterium CG08_land_8_20_14_0_20_43_14]
MDSSDNSDVQIPQKDQEKEAPLNLGPTESPRKRGSRFESTTRVSQWTTGGGIKKPCHPGHGHQ